MPHPIGERSASVDAGDGVWVDWGKGILMINCHMLQYLRASFLEIWHPKKLMRFGEMYHEQRLKRLPDCMV